MAARGAETGRMRRCLLLPTALGACAVLPGQAAAAGPGESFLLSGLPGLAAPTPNEFAWNESGSAGDSGGSVDVSADGRWVAFISEADGLVGAPEDRRYYNIFVKDLQTGKLVPVTDHAALSARHHLAGRPSPHGRLHAQRAG